MAASGTQPTHRSPAFAFLDRRHSSAPPAGASRTPQRAKERDIVGHQLMPPVRPWRGLRGADAFGNGAFGAQRRNADGSIRAHPGLDVLGQPGDSAVSPHDGVVSHVGMAYLDSDLGSIHIHSPHFRTKILYASPSVRRGDEVRANAKVGVVQNIAAYYAAEGKMGNHIHLEVHRLDPASGEWVLVDPEPLLLAPQGDA